MDENLLIIILKPFILKHFTFTLRARGQEPKALDRWMLRKI